MKQIKSVLQYIFKNFWRTILPVVPTAVLLGFFYRPAFSLTFIRDYSNTEISGLGDVFGLLYSSTPIYWLLIVPIMFVVLLISGSYLITMVYKHFRTGKISVRTPLININHGISSVLPTILIIFAVMIVYKFLFACLVSLISMLPAATYYPNAAEVTLSCILGIITYFPVVYLLMYPILTASVMLVYGYPLNDAFSFVFKLHGRPGFYVTAFSYLFPFIINALVSYLVLFTSPHVVIEYIIESLNVLFVVAYLIVFSISSVFDMLELERMDNKKLY